MSETQSLNCVLCNEEFDDKEKLQDHFRKHGDPTFDKVTKIKFKTQNEIPTSTEKIEENEMVSCDVCEEVFPTISKAITHKHKVHPDHDGKYFCPWCGKLFTMKHLYNKHLQSNHEGLTNVDVKDFHCDCCQVDFFIPSAMLHHNKFFHRQDTEMNHIGNSKKIKLFNQELIQIFYCPFCGEEYNNKVNLHKHLEDDHGDENQTPEDILRCPLCESTFYHLDAYELHLTFHSTEDLYSERNEMVNEIVEFSLDAVPPLMEKVQDTKEMFGIDSFLQMVMDQDSGDTEALDKTSKSKKHKKHKKSKKAAITLDEFLNMNKDVFGDGLNVQGIEEVPTGSVLKKHKAKKVLNSAQAKAVNSDLAKLKRQGIIIKAKSNQASPKLEVPEKLAKLTTNKIEKGPHDAMVKPAAHIISKLMKQGVNEIKIIKKYNDLKTDDYQSDKVDSSSDYNKTEITNSSKPTATNTSQTESDNTKQLDDKSYEDSTKHDIQNVKCHDNSTSIQNENYESENDESINKNDDDDDFNETDTQKIMKSETSIKELQNKNEPLFVKLGPEEIKSPNSKHDEDQALDESEEGLNRHPEKPTNESDKKSVDISNSLSFNKGITIKPVGQTTKNIKFRNNDEQKPVLNKHINVLKGLSKHITIKSPIKNSSFYDDEGSEKEDSLENCDEDVKNKLATLQKKDSSKALPNTNYLHKNDALPKSPKNEIDNNTKDITNHLNLNLLKKLKYVTAKPLTTLKHNEQTPNPATHTKILGKTSPKPSLEDEIEIFNIDDSDSDPDAEHVINNKQNKTQDFKIMKLSTTNSNDNPLNDVIRHVKKIGNIQPTLQKRIVSQNQLSDGQQEYRKTINRLSETKTMTQNRQNPSDKPTNLQKTLQNLSQHITIKSNMPKQSPNYNIHSDTDNEHLEHNSDDGNESDSSIGKVKITELGEDETDHDHEGYDESEMNVSVQSPQEDEEEHCDENDDFTDFEAQIKTNPIKICHPDNQTIKQHTPHNIANINKELTIKSLRPTNHTSEDDISTTEDEIFETPQTSRNIPINTSSQGKILNINKTVTQPSHSVTDQKSTASSNQVNTVKTVKTYKSQTVIEEVTTTVTKTIRTVNRNESHNATHNVIRPPKIMNTSGPIRGTGRIRPAGHVVGTKIRNMTPHIRSPHSNMMRPSNQMVSIRPRFVNPQMQSYNIRKLTPLPQNTTRLPHTNKVLNVQATQSPKRSTDDDSDQTVIFKKPKPVMPSPKQQNNCETAVQYSCSSQSKSNFSSVKVVKGNTVATSQVRSESCMSSQQHLSKLSGVSGLKIVKSSTKQTTQMENRSEINTAKNNTMAVLEKLQSQGLLIKKPRLEPSDNVTEAEFYSGSDEEQYEDEHFDE